MDLGFPTLWGTKDTITVLALVSSVATTARALRLQTVADQLTINAMVPEIDQVGEPAYERSPRLAAERALKRAALERAALQRRSSSMYWVLAVIGAAIASLPWLVLLGIALAIGWIIFTVFRFRRGHSSIERRLTILQQVREHNSMNQLGGYVFDQNIYMQIDHVFTTHDNHLDALEKSIQEAIRVRAADNREYAARQRAQFASSEATAPEPSAGTLDAEPPQPPA